MAQYPRPADWLMDDKKHESAAKARKYSPRFPRPLWTIWRHNNTRLSLLGYQSLTIWFMHFHLWAMRGTTNNMREVFPWKKESPTHTWQEHQKVWLDFPGNYVSKSLLWKAHYSDSPIHIAALISQISLATQLARAMWTLSARFRYIAGK